MPVESSNLYGISIWKIHARSHGNFFICFWDFQQQWMSCMDDKLRSSSSLKAGLSPQIKQTKKKTIQNNLLYVTRQPHVKTYLCVYYSAHNVMHQAISPDQTNKQINNTICHQTTSHQNISLCNSSAHNVMHGWQIAFFQFSKARLSPQTKQTNK